MPSSAVPLAKEIWRRSVLGRRPPLNASVHQAGQAHTSPRPELLAIVIAIEQSRWPIHIFSDNLGYVTAVQRLLSGEYTSIMKDNRDPWRRVQRRILPTQKHINITWVKGHAGEADIAKGNSTIAHQNGNNNADTLADEGARSIALPEPLFQAHQLRRRIVISIQAMFLACYTRRQKTREQAALETLLERHLEGEVPQ